MIWGSQGQIRWALSGLLRYTTPGTITTRPVQLQGLGLVLSLIIGYFNSYRCKTEPPEERYKLSGESKRLRRSGEVGEKRKETRERETASEHNHLGRDRKEKERQESEMSLEEWAKF